MDTEACPVSKMTSTAAGSISSPPSSALSTDTFDADVSLLPFPLSAAFLSISAMTSSEYSAVFERLMKVTTSCTSSSVMKQPCTRLGFPCPNGA